MLDKCIDQHKEPVCFWLHLIAFFIGIWALWTHNWTGIVVSVALLVIGHLSAMKKKKSVVKEKPAEQTPSTE